MLAPLLRDDAMAFRIESDDVALLHHVDAKLGQRLRAPREALIVGFLAAHVIRGEDGAVRRHPGIRESPDSAFVPCAAQRDGGVHPRRPVADDGHDLRLRRGSRPIA